MPKDTSCWLNGIFFYTPLHYEVKGLRLQIQDLDDNDLVDEILENFWDIEHETVEDILCDFTERQYLTKEEREELINFYILAEMQDFLIIQDNEEW